MRNQPNRWLGVALVATIPSFWGCTADSSNDAGLAGGSAADGSTSTSDATSSDGDAANGDARDSSIVDAGAVTDAVADSAADSVADADAAADAGADADAGAVADASAAADALAAAGCPPDGGAVPNDLFCTGLYSDWATKTIATNAIAYTPSFLLWSDSAQKSRWIYLPPGAQIDTTDMDNWVFPVGTKIWKQFSLAGQIIETRLIWKTSVSQWNLVVYRWTADGKSATLIANGETNVNGTTYEIPSTFQCNLCHAGRTDNVLGFDLIGLGVTGATGITLADLVTQNRLTKAPPATTIVIPEDATQKAAPALGYLHMNCGVTCHNSQGGAAVTNLFMKLPARQLYPVDGGVATVAQLDTYTTAVDKFGIMLTQYKRIARHDAAHSLVTLMAGTRDPDAGGIKPMPPIITHQVDAVGLATMQAWINAL